jgi:hypothetical protein
MRSRQGPVFHNTRGMLQKIDTLPSPPQWACRPYHLDGLDAEGQPQRVELWYRNPVELIKELISNPHFATGMAYRPRRNTRGTQRIYSEMQDGDWWWDMQVRLALLPLWDHEPGSPAYYRKD